MDTIRDNALMLKVKSGDLDKMGLLFERYHRVLFSFLYRMTKQRESSEDMVQNVFSFLQNAEVPAFVHLKR